MGGGGMGGGGMGGGMRFGGGSGAGYGGSGGGYGGGGGGGNGYSSGNSFGGGGYGGGGGSYGGSGGGGYSSTGGGYNSTGGGGGSGGKFIVRMRGLPFRVTENDIAEVSGMLVLLWTFLTVTNVLSFMDFSGLAPLWTPSILASNTTTPASPPGTPTSLSLGEFLGHFFCCGDQKNCFFL